MSYFDIVPGTKADRYTVIKNSTGRAVATNRAFRDAVRVATDLNARERRLARQVSR